MANGAAIYVDNNDDLISNLSLLGKAKLVLFTIVSTIGFAHPAGFVSETKSNQCDEWQAFFMATVLFTLLLAIDNGLCTSQEVGWGRYQTHRIREWDPN